MSFVNYRNGNYVVYFNTENGDKIRNTHADKFIPAFAENCDVTITDCCDGGCQFCYAGCTKNGKHGNLNAKFLETLHPYTELAINGNDLTHPDLEIFMTRMKERHVIVNITVNQKHFEQHFDKLVSWQDKKLIHGIGVSLVSATDSFIEKLKKSKNTIIHVINGLFSKKDEEKLYGNDFDILILGYKTTGRGQNFLDNNNDHVIKNQIWLKNELKLMFDGFKTVEFDNLALEQLGVKSIVSAETWSKHYMGNDGNFTFFINLVDGYFAKNSTSKTHYNLMDSVDAMFDVIRNQDKQI